MGRVLVADVASQLQSSNPYVRKKAALALIRILKRIPELSEDYVDGIIGLLKDRSHGVLIAAVQLILEVGFNALRKAQSVNQLLLDCFVAVHGD